MSDDELREAASDLLGMCSAKGYRDAVNILVAGVPPLLDRLAAAESECAELHDALDAMRMTADEVQAKQRQRRQAGVWAQAAAAVEQATGRTIAVSG